jgi:signal peptidase I
MTDDAAPRREPVRAEEARPPQATDRPVPGPVAPEPTASSRSVPAESVPADSNSVDSRSVDSDPAESDSIERDPGEPLVPVVAGSGRAKRARSPKKPSRWWEFPVLAAVAILVAILVKTFLVQPFYIPSESMEKTLHGCAGCNGDKILVNKVVYHSRDPHPGEIIVFRAPTGWEPETIAPQTNAVTGAIRWFGQLVGVIPPDERDLVKRVIAVGGQTVRGDAQGNVQISETGANGPWRTLNEPFVHLDGPDSMATFGPVTVPKGRLWVMGDHRNDSADSRYHCGASPTSCDPTTSTVALSSVIGKAFVVAWPISRWRTLGTPSTVTTKGGAEAGSALPLVVAGLVGLPFWLWRRKTRS